MFSEKSKWLIDQLRARAFDKKQVLAVRFARDDRYSKDKLASKRGDKFRAVAAHNVDEIRQVLSQNGHYDVVGVDEIQFYTPDLADLAVELQRQGTDFLAAGLDLDFSGSPWETTMKLMAAADEIHKTVAVCLKCPKEIDRWRATRTQRLINGRPAPKNSPRVLIGGREQYTARCLLHHQVPEK